MQLTWLGHSACHLETAGQNILIDPFWTGNPTFPSGYEDRVRKVDVIVVTHGHEDHLGDTARLAKKYGAVIVAQYEICSWLGGQGADQIEPMNTGGCIEREGVRYCMVQALHSSAIIKDGVADHHGRPGRLRDQGRGPERLPRRRYRDLLGHGADPALY